MSPPLLDGFDSAALAEALAALGADAWLLYDFRRVNPVAERILGPTGMGTRRLFVLLPKSGRPVAVAHRIELQPLADFPGEVRPYGSWRELHGELQALARGRTLAMEVSPEDAVPYLDRVPHGVVQLLERFGARVVSSAPLVSRFAARWSADEAAGHRRAAQALAEIAPEALAWAGRETARGAEVREVALQRRVLEAIERAGLTTDHPPIAAFGPNSAMPHYEPRAAADRRLEAGQVLLLDLWAGPTLGSVFADQTWMGFAGRSPDAEVRKVWETVRGARDAAVALLRERWQRPGKGEGGGGWAGGVLRVWPPRSIFAAPDESTQCARRIDPVLRRRTPRSPSDSLYRPSLRLAKSFCVRFDFASKPTTFHAADTTLEVMACHRVLRSHIHTHARLWTTIP